MAGLFAGSVGVKKFGKFQPCHYRLDVFDQSLFFVSKCWAFDLNAEVEQRQYQIIFMMLSILGFYIVNIEIVTITMLDFQG